MRRPTRLSASVVAVAALLLGGVVAVAPAAAADPTPTTGSGGADRLCAPATPGTVTCFAEQQTGVTAHAADGLPAGYGPADLRSAYGIPTTGGSGVTVAVVGAYDNPTVAADLATYRSTFGLPALQAGQFTTVNQSGAASPLPTYNAGWAGETALDTQMITATCPSCSILLVEANTPSLSDIGTAVDTAVRLGATYVSNSYGTDGGDANSGPRASHYTASGVTFVASTGDDGYGGGASFPATAPGVVAVGGTSLSKASTARGWSERAWSGAGSGCSSTFAKPAFQSGVATGCASRAVADVSAVADPNTGVAVYNGNVGRWGVFGGTSASAPIISGIAAHAGDPGQNLGAVYGNTASFHDVTAGSTGSCGTILCNATSGWDGPTGVGTPDGIAGFVPNPLSCGGTPASVDDTSGSTAAGRFVPLAPTRVLDTRSPVTTLGPDSSRSLDLASNFPDGTASSVVLNVTVTNPTASGFVTVYPAGAARPLASNLNTVPGLTRANQVTVAVGAAAGVASGIVVYNSAGNTDLVVDLLGYYTTAGDVVPALTYHPATTPARVLDTRSTGGPLGNAGNRGRVCVTTSLSVGGTGVGRIAAVAVTLTAVGSNGPGYLKAWNGDASAEPLVSSLNYNAGQTVPNAAVVPVSCVDTACTTVTFAVANRVATATNVLVDLVGVYAADTAGGLVLRSQTPQRIADSRTPFGLNPLGQDSSGAVQVAAAVSAGAKAVAANVTAVAPTQLTYLTVYGAVRPPTSNLNPVAGEVVAGAVVSGLDAGGFLRIYNGLGRTDVVVDIAGLFVPFA